MKVIVAPKANKDYNKIPKREQVKIKKKLLILELNPHEGKKLGGELESLYSLRAWPYRILYCIDEKHQVLYITSILHRQGAYK